MSLFDSLKELNTMTISDNEYGMINTIALYFTEGFWSELESFQLLLGTSIGITAVVILIKKITTGEIRNDSWNYSIYNTIQTLVHDID